MALRGSSKWFADRLERKVAVRYEGIKSPSSGAAASDQGDVRVGLPIEGWLIECKHRGSFDKPASSVSVKLNELEKIADEAWSENRNPMMVLSMYAPDSVLADSEGCVLVTVRLTSYDEDDEA